MKYQRICVIGGTGFVGQHLITHLANQGRHLKVLVRHAHRAKAFKVLDTVQVVEIPSTSVETLSREFQDCDTVVNLVGILNEEGKHSFREAHVELPRRIGDAAAAAKIKRLLHMSALNADFTNGVSDYLRSKGEGEDIAHLGTGAGIKVTSFRPSVIFGPGDSFINRFASLLKIAPVLPLACPESSFAPVYVGDVVAAFEASLEDESTFSKRLELGGPNIYTLKEIVQFTANMLGLKRIVIGLPDNIARFQAKVFERLPGKIFTTDNFKSLQLPSVCSDNALPKLGIDPKSMEAVVPMYLQNRSQRGRYHQLRRLGRR